MLENYADLIYNLARLLLILTASFNLKMVRILNLKLPMKDVNQKMILVLSLVQEEMKTIDQLAVTQELYAKICSLEEKIIHQ